MTIIPQGRAMGSDAGVLVPMVWTVLLLQAILHVTGFETTATIDQTSNRSDSTFADSGLTVNRTTPAFDLTTSTAEPDYAPENLTVIAVANDTLDVRWAGEGLHGYVMQWFPTAVQGADWMVKTIESDSSKVYHEKLTGLDAGQLYNVTVRANSSDDLTEVFSQSSTTWPNAPDDVTVETFTTETISLQWGKARGSVDGYSLTYCCKGVCHTNNTQLTHANLTHLQDGCLYNISLRSQSHNTSSDVWTFLQSTRPRPVTFLNTSMISPTSASLWWTEVPPLNYNVEYTVCVETVSCTHGPVCDRTYNITGRGNSTRVTDIVPGRSYRFTVSSLSNNVSSRPFTSDVYHTHPLQPSKVTINPYPEETFATVNITPPQNTQFDGFNITWTDVDTGNIWWKVHNITMLKDIAINVTGLTAGHLYELGVYTLSGGETSGQTRLYPGGQFIARPSQPDSVNVTVVNATALRVNWSAVLGQCTIVNIAWSASKNSVLIDKSEWCNKNSTLLTMLQSNEKYRINLTTQRTWSNLTAISDVSTRSAWTLSAEVTQPEYQPVSPRSLQLSWKFPELNVKKQLRHYIIEVLNPKTSECLQGVLLSRKKFTPDTYKTRNCTRNWKRGNFSGFNNVTYIVDALDACAKYSVSVSAVNNPGCRGVSHVEPVTMPAAEPSSSVVISKTSSTTNAVYIEWGKLVLYNSQCPIITYEINVTYENCSTGLREDITYNVSNLSSNVTQLQPHWNYTFTVSAYTFAGRGSSVSKPVSVITKQTEPGQPQQLTVTSQSHDTINMTWLPPSSCKRNGILTQYDVIYAYLDPLRQMVVRRTVSVPSSQTSVTLIDAVYPYTVYNLTVQAVTIGQGDASRTSTRTTQWYPGVIDPSTLIFETTPRSVNLSWAAPNSPNGIIVNYTVCYRCYHVKLDMSCTHPNVEMTTNGSSPTLLVAGLLPYKRFEFRVKASTGVGAGNYSKPKYAMTDVGVPLKPEPVTVLPNKPDSVYIEWKGPKYCTGPTNYTVSVVDAHDSNKTFTRLAEGCYDHDMNIPGLDANWPYRVDILAETSEGRNRSRLYEFTTQQADPRAVRGLEARAEGGKCTEPALRVEWKTLVGRERRGIIQNYTLHFSTTLGEHFTRSFKECTNTSQHVYIPVSPERQYTIQIWAYSEMQKGEVSRLPKVNSGSCPPMLPEAEGFVGPTSVIQSTEQNGLKSKKTQYRLMVNQSFFDDTSNGALQERGVIVMDADEAGSSAQRFVNKDEFASKFVDNWATVMDMSVIKSYRVILDHSDDGRSRRSAVVPSGGHEIILGQDENCNTDRTYKCNGYLRADSRYKVRVYTCTEAGCSVTSASRAFQTAAYIKGGVIAAAVLVPIIFIIIILVVLVFIMQKKQLGPFKKKTRPEGTGDSGKLNEAFVDLEEIVPKKPGTFSQKNFGEHVKMMHKDSDLMFSEEYKLLKMLSPRTPTTDAELPQNRIKNRYTNILPFDHSRVKLLSIEDDEGSDYINANYMPGYNSRREFIAAQGPLPSTKDDFWRMIWEQNVPMIVMLTRLVENGREKCSQYWPPDNEAVYYGDLQVSMRSESVLDNYTIRIFDIQLGHMTRMIKQFHFKAWRDHSCPLTTDVMLNFVLVVRSHVRPNFKGPIMIHCSAGVGRTGTFICVDHLLQHIRDYDGIDIFGMVLEMRQYRCNMVQTEDQYIYIHDCLRDALERQQLEDEEDEADGPIYASRC